MAYRILLRRDTSTNWTSNDPVLASGEPGFETDTGKMKVGNGTTTWQSLGYFQGATGPAGATGSSITNGAVTGPNDFYGTQTIDGDLEVTGSTRLTGTISVTGGVFINSSDFNGDVTVPLGSNGFLVGPITNNGTINVEGVFAIL
jgi:hypothetical protein